MSINGQSDTAFVRQIDETKGQILKNYNKTIALAKINGAFSSMLKARQWDKVYECSFSLYYLNQKKIILTKEAIENLEYQIKQVPSENYKLIGKLNHLIYFFLNTSGKIHNALPFAEKALEKYNNGSDSTSKSKLLNSLCISFIQLRDFSQAVAYGKQSIKLAPYNDKRTRALPLQNVGLAYLYNKNGFLGRTYLEKAREIYVNDLTNNYRWIAETYMVEGDLVCAMIYADSSINYAIKTKSENLISALKLKGDIYQSEKKYSQAVVFFKKALSEIDKHKKTALNEKEIFEFDPRELAKILLPLAQCEMQLGQLDLAQRHIDQGIVLIGPNIGKIESAKKQNIPLAMADMYYLDFLYENARLQWIRYQKTKDINNIQATLKQLTLCADFSSQMKTFFSNYSAKRKVAIDSKKVYALMMEAQYALHKINSKSNDKERAFKLSQIYNSFTLREQLNERNALVNAVSNEKLIERYFSLKRNYLDAIESAWTDSLQHDMFTVQQWKLDFYKLSDSLENKFPKFKKYKQGVSLVSSSDIQKNLKSDEVFINYFMSDSAIFSFTITKGKFEFTRTQKEKSFDQKIQGFLNTLSTHMDSTMAYSKANEILRQNGSFLYNQLFTNLNLLSSAKKLIIVPDGILYRLPFETLVINSEKNMTSKQPYLVSKFNTRYLYYAGQLIDQYDENSNSKILSFGLEYDKFTLESMKDIKREEVPDWLSSQFRSESMAHLLFSDDEAVKVAEIYSGKSFINEDALPENLIENAGDFGLLHISAHSYVDYDNPDQSAIVLTKKDSTHNNLLTSERIESLQLNSKLVTLSSCNSSSGFIAEGEGVSSLTKSFLTAGSKAVIGSNWSVSDQVTSIFQERFYLHLELGLTPSEALRQAKLDILDEELNLVNPVYRHPTYWAAWTLFGSDEVIEKQSNTPYYLFGLVLLCLLGLYIITQKRMKA